MSRRLASILLLCLALLLGACHGVKSLVPPNMRPTTDAGKMLDLAKQQLQQATPCCGSYADFSYQTMLPWRPTKFELCSGSLLANLINVRSYFLVFRLPQDAKLP